MYPPLIVDRKNQKWLLFTGIMNDLSRRRIIRERDVLVFDKGYYSYPHYADGICKFKVIPLFISKNRM